MRSLKVKLPQRVHKIIQTYTKEQIANNKRFWRSYYSSDIVTIPTKLCIIALFQKAGFETENLKS